MSSSSKLQFGCYNVFCRDRTNENGSLEETVMCKPLTQNEYADGWQVVLPKPKKRKGEESVVYNWNVTLAQLPPHLWNRCHLNYRDGKPNYNRVKDGIYVYNVAYNDFDDMLISLNRELSKVYPNSAMVRELYEQVKTQTSGWLLTRAKNFLNSL